MKGRGSRGSEEKRRHRIPTNPRDPIRADTLNRRTGIKESRRNTKRKEPVSGLNFKKTPKKRPVTEKRREEGSDSN